MTRIRPTAASRPNGVSVIQNAAADPDTATGRLRKTSPAAQPESNTIATASTTSTRPAPKTSQSSLPLSSSCHSNCSSPAE